MAPAEREARGNKRLRHEEFEFVNPSSTVTTDTFTKAEFQGLKNDNDFLHLEVKKLKSALCAEETSHEVTKLTFQQTEVPQCYNVNSNTPNANACIMRQFRKFLLNVLSYVFPPISLRQHYEMTRYIILGINGLAHLSSQTQIRHQEFHTIWTKANQTTKVLLVFM